MKELRFVRLQFVAALGVACFTGAALVGCAQTDTCFDSIQMNSAIDVSANADPKQPSAMATLTGTAELIYPCDAPEEELALRNMVLYDSDRTTPISDVDVQFEGGSVLTTPGACSGLGQTSKKVTLTSSGVLNSLVSMHCGSQLWLAGNMERAGCASGTKLDVAAQVAIGCP